MVALIAQAWVSHTVTGKTVSPNTHNLRLAIMSSFYAFTIKRGLLPITTNPIALVERRPAQAYANAHGIPAATIAASLKRIDRKKIAGKRDYALLSVALQTGRRLSELCHLRCRDIEVEGNTITLNWRRTKGGKSISDTLPTAVSKALVAYLGELYPDGIPDDASPVWVSLKGPDRTRGKALGRQAVADLCEKWLGTSKVHSLRHSFAVHMEAAGAKVSDIQFRLGHSNLATTGRYLASLKSSVNDHAEALARMYEIEG
jgi:integrase/recombinase XerD